MINLIKPFFAIVLISHSFSCFALDENEKKAHNQITIEADELIYDKKEELISAQGNVYIEQNNFRIVTNKVVYDKNNYLYAVGDLVFSNNDKNYFFGNKAFFDKKNNTGVIIRFKARIGHKGLLSSDFAQMVDKNTFIVQNLVFSTCKVCKDNFIPNTEFDFNNFEKFYSKRKELMKLELIKILNLSTEQVN